MPSIAGPVMLPVGGLVIVSVMAALFRETALTSQRKD
jgi:hypothetical protein